MDKRKGLIKKRRMERKWKDRKDGACESNQNEAYTSMKVSNKKFN